MNSSVGQERETTQSYPLGPDILKNWMHTLHTGGPDSIIGTTWFPKHCQEQSPCAEPGVAPE